MMRLTIERGHNDLVRLLTRSILIFFTHDRIQIVDIDFLLGLYGRKWEQEEKP